MVDNRTFEDVYKICELGVEFQLDSAVRHLKSVVTSQNQGLRAVGTQHHAEHVAYLWHGGSVLGNLQPVFRA